MRKYKGEIGLLIVAMIWGSGFIGSVIGLGFMTPYEALTGRFLVASLLLNIIFFKRIPKLSRQTLKRGVIIGFFLYVAFLLQTLGLELTTPSKNAFLTAVNVVVVPLLGFLILKNRLNRKDIAGAILALAGVGIISLDPTGAINLGDFLSFLCAIAFAYHIFYTGQYSAEESAIDLTLVQMNTAFLFSLAVMLLRGETLLGKAGGGYAAILYLGVFSTTLAFFMQTFSQKSTTNTRAAIIMSTEALFATVFSILVFHETITMKMVFGSVVIFSAVLLPLLPDRKAEGLAGGNDLTGRNGEGFSTPLEGEQEAI